MCDDVEVADAAWRLDHDLMLPVGTVLKDVPSGDLLIVIDRGYGYSCTYYLECLRDTSRRFWYKCQLMRRCEIVRLSEGDEDFTVWEKMDKNYRCDNFE